MKKEIVKTQKAPRAIGPYSQGVAVSAVQEICFFSGQIAIDPSTQKMTEGDEAAQTRRILDNVSALLGSRGMTFANVVKSTVFIADMTKFGEVNAVYKTYFESDPPARSCVQAGTLPAGAKVEIEIIACK